MEAALPGLLAEQALRRHGANAYDPDTVEQLVLAMTGSKAAAENAACDREREIAREADRRAGLSVG